MKRVFVGRVKYYGSDLRLGAYNYHLPDITTSVITTAATFPVDISMLKWGKNGNVFTFAATVYSGMTMEETKDFDDLKDKYYPSTAMVYDNPPIYRWDTFFTVSLLKQSYIYSFHFIYV